MIYHYVGLNTVYVQIPQVPKQKYHISTRSNKVYDMTNRKVCITAPLVAAIFPNFPLHFSLTLLLVYQCRNFVVAFVTKPPQYMLVSCPVHLSG